MCRFTKLSYSRLSLESAKLRGLRGYEGCVGAWVKIKFAWFKVKVAWVKIKIAWVKIKIAWVKEDFKFEN